MIDLTKPIELMDGTEVEFLGLMNGEYCLNIKVHGEHLYVDKNGQFCGVQIIRNRLESKKILVDFWIGVYWNGTDSYTRKYASYVAAIRHLSSCNEAVGIVRVRREVIVGEELLS